MRVFLDQFLHILIVAPFGDPGYAHEIDEHACPYEYASITAESLEDIDKSRNQHGLRRVDWIVIDDHILADRVLTCILGGIKRCID